MWMKRMELLSREYSEEIILLPRSKFKAHELLFYSLQEDALVVEVIAGTSSGIMTSGKGSEDIPTVTSYGVSSYQRAVLSRK
jgi:hypothetical protein